MVDVARRHRAGRPGRHAAALGAALPEGPGADPGWAHRQGRTRSGCGPTATSCPASAARPTATPRTSSTRTCWLGPAPKRPYNPNRALYHFRWFWDYSGGQMTNLGQHSLDIVHWCPRPRRRRRRSPAPGGGSACRTTARRPTRRTRLFEYPGWTATWSHREASRGRCRRRTALEFCGTTREPDDLAQGVRRHARPRGRPERRRPPVRPATPGRRPAAHAAAVGRAGALDRGRSRTNRATSIDQFRRHARDFLDCVKSRREPISDLESGHRVATACHLANLSLRLGRKLRWDASRETIVGDPEADDRLERPYRAPWDAVLKGLGVG